MEAQETACLQELFAPKALVVLEGARGHMRATLPEPQCEDSEVLLKNVPDDAVIFKPDAMPNLGNPVFFAGGHGECQRSDYVIISPTRKLVFFIEMKRTSDSQKKIREQLMGAECIFEYCREVVKKFWQFPDFLESLEKRYVAICHTGSRKRGTRGKRILGSGRTLGDIRRLDFATTLHFRELYAVV